MPHPEGLLSTQEVAQLTGRYHTTISGWARAGDLPFAECKTVYGQKKYLFRPLDVVRVMVEKDETCKRQNHRRVSEPKATSGTLKAEETYEELCRVVEERLRPENLPSWWHRSSERMRHDDNE